LDKIVLMTSFSSSQASLDGIYFYTHVGWTDNRLPRLHSGLMGAFVAAAASAPICQTAHTKARAICIVRALALPKNVNLPKNTVQNFNDLLHSYAAFIGK
jgi:hypothetical protein